MGRHGTRRIAGTWFANYKSVRYRRTATRLCWKRVRLCWKGKGKERMSRLPATIEAGTQPRLGTAIVTGASRGIGAGITRAFIDLGYNVVPTL